MSMPWTRGLILLGAAGIVVLAVGCGTTLDDSLTDLEVGDCVLSPEAEAEAEAEEVASLDLVDCSEPDAIKVGYVFDLEGESWPGLVTIESEVRVNCPPTHFTLYPTEDSWDNAGDRAVICFVSADEDLSTPSPTEEPTPIPTNPDCSPATEEAPEVDVKVYDSVPERIIDPEKSYTAVVHTVRGDFTMKLRPDLAPNHVNSFVFLVREGFYDGVTFHRVLLGGIAQTGDPTGSGNGGPGYSLAAEFTTEVPYTEGVVGAARLDDPDSAGSQWFVTLDEVPSLDGLYTVFGEVTDGMDVVHCITKRYPLQNPSPPPGDKIVGIDIIEG